MDLRGSRTWCGFPLHCANIFRTFLHLMWVPIIWDIVLVCLIFLVWCCFCCPSFEDSEPPIRLYHPDLLGSGRNESEQQIQQGGFTIGAKRTASTSTAAEANPETSPTFHCSLASWHGPKATVSFWTISVVGGWFKAHCLRNLLLCKWSANCHAVLCFMGFLGYGHSSMGWDKLDSIWIWGIWAAGFRLF